MRASVEQLTAVSGRDVQQLWNSAEVLNVRNVLHVAFDQGLNVRFGPGLPAL